MTTKTHNMLKRISLILGICVIIVPLFVSSVQYVDKIQDNTSMLKSFELRITDEEIARKSIDDSLHKENAELEKRMLSQYSDIQVQLAVLNTNITYLVKQYDRENGR